MPRSRVTRMLAPALAAGLLTAPFLLVPLSRASAQISIGVDITAAPPELPVYEQPPLPAPGYLWTPGFWSYGEDGYFWVPGTWVEPPEPGLLWTPGYWGWNGGHYLFNQGYWGQHVGFYGGINYGYGYTGNGFEGGEWHGRDFAYNRAANNFGNVHVTNVYNRTIVNVTNVRRVSFNGPNGVNARPSSQQEQWAHEHHVEATAAQQQHREAAAQNRELRASVNHGNPAIKTTDRPGDFSKFHAAPGPENHGPQPDEHRAGAPGPHPVASPRPAMNPHPSALGREGIAPHPMAAEPHREAAPRPETPHPEAPRPEAPRPQGVPHPEGAMHAMTPRPAAPPHPAAAPHPEGHPGEPPH